VSNNLNDIAGLPDELNIGDDLARSEQRALIRIDTRRYGKAMTIVEGLDSSSVDLEELASTLKSKLAVGGTVTDGHIELQGEHRSQLREILGEDGFQVKT
jgi:translation initiation factor 1